MNSSNAQFRVLVVDDDKAMRTSLVDLLDAAGWRTDAISRAEQVDEKLAEFLPDVIVSDVRMPGMTGIELLASLDPATAPPLVLISAHGDIAMAVDAIQNGAYGFIEKPFEPRRLLTVLRNASEKNRLAQRADRLKARLAKLSGLDRVLLGQTPEIKAVREEVLNLADTAVPVLLLGETGTGKELVAHALHDLSERSDGPFVALNCATIPPERFEAEMFGVHEESPGRIAASESGSLFLDEICACPLPVQAKLLRAIETREVTPIGSTTPKPVDFRLITASNEDPHAAISDGRFRPDLLYRINTVALTLPTLRQRRDDMVLLYSHFLENSAETHEIEPPTLSSDDISALLAHDWPGNVRELRHSAERYVLSARRGQGSVKGSIRTDQLVDDVPDTLREAVAAFERQMIARAIRAHGGRMDAVAEALGIGRRTLNEKIVKLGLNKDALL